jgi:hypothetical protein
MQMSAGKLGAMTLAAARGGIRTPASAAVETRGSKPPDAVVSARALASLDLPWQIAGPRGGAL